jgi:PTH1 family peptidyl-tRNA hydrolase
VVDEYARRAGATFEASRAEALTAHIRGVAPVLLIKPLTFMNLSGEAIAALLRYYRVDGGDLLVIADDVNLPLGRLRARPGGSAGGHNGFRSIAQHLGTDGFPRLRVGVGRGDQRRDLASHVLSRFAAEERPAIEAAVASAADAAQLFAAEDIAAVMNRFNADPARTDRKELAEQDDASTEESQT